MCVFLGDWNFDVIFLGYKSLPVILKKKIVNFWVIIMNSMCSPSQRMNLNRRYCEVKQSNKKDRYKTM